MKNLNTTIFMLVFLNSFISSHASDIKEEFIEGKITFYNYFKFYSSRVKISENYDRDFFKELDPVVFSIEEGKDYVLNVKHKNLAYKTLYALPLKIDFYNEYSRWLGKRNIIISADYINKNRVPLFLLLTFFNKKQEPELLKE